MLSPPLMLFILSRIISLSTSVTPRFTLLDSLPVDFLFIRLSCLLLLLIALPLLSLPLSLLLPSKLVSLRVLSLVCLRPLLAGTYSQLVRLLVGVPRADVFLLLSLLLSYF